MGENSFIATAFGLAAYYLTPLVSYTSGRTRQSCRNAVREYIHAMFDYNLPFHVWLRQRRKTLDMTQEGLAECVGCSKGAIQKIETKERRPSKQIAQRLALCSHVPPEEERDFVRFARTSAVLSEQILPGGSPIISTQSCRRG